MLFLLISLVSQADSAYDLRDFRIPEVGVMRLDFRGGLNFGFDNEVVFYEIEDVDDYMDRDFDFGNQFSFIWKVEHWGEQRFLHLSIRPRVVTDLYNSRREYSSDTLITYNRFRSYAGGFGNFIGGWYLGKSPLFVSGKTNITAHYGIEYVDNAYGSGFSLYGYPPRFEIVIGPGIGKIRSVGPAARAWLFLEELGEDSYVNIDILANTLAREWKYQLDYWRYKKHFYQDIENELADAGIVDELTPYQVMRMQEIIDNTSHFYRTHGTRLSILGGIEFNSYLRDSDDWTPKVEISILGGYPISRRWQASFSTSSIVYFPMYYSPVGYRPDFRSNFEGDLSYYIGDSWKLSSEVTGLAGAEYFIQDYWWNVNLMFTPLELTWYVDNKVEFYVSPEYTYNLNTITSRTRESHSIRFSAGFTWRLR